MEQVTDVGSEPGEEAGYAHSIRLRDRWSSRVDALQVLPPETAYITLKIHSMFAAQLEYARAVEVQRVAGHQA